VERHGEQLVTRYFGATIWWSFQR